MQKLFRSMTVFSGSIRTRQLTETNRFVFRSKAERDKNRLILWVLVPPVIDSEQFLRIDDPRR